MRGNHHFGDAALAAVGERFHVAAQNALERLLLSPLRVLRRERFHPIERERDLHVDGLLGPERPVVVEHGDALRRRHEIGSALARHALDELDDRPLRSALVPRREGVGLRGLAGCRDERGLGRLRLGRRTVAACGWGEEPQEQDERREPARVRCESSRAVHGDARASCGPWQDARCGGIGPWLATRVLRRCHRLLLPRSQQGTCLGRRALRRLVPSLANFVDVAVEEEGEEGADNCNGGGLADVVPGRRDRRAHDVGGELKREPRDEPARILEPERALLVRGVSRKDAADDADDRLQ